ncbi:protein lin-52 homolog isoform X1 [Ornithodoros turicata]|uniref:protein lin-52 homolog isoform X1 n=1 Tax=Ornithodoros turicata TaxID=34597 RepID=UPI0031386783
MAASNGDEPATQDTPSDNMTSDSILLSNEQLDGRLSPDLWPEPMPGVSEFATLLSVSANIKNVKLKPMDDSDCFNQVHNTKPKWALDSEGMIMLQELGSLTAAALLEKVKDLQNLAYKLGIEEGSVPDVVPLAEVQVQQRVRWAQVGAILRRLSDDFSNMVHYDDTPQDSRRPD